MSRMQRWLSSGTTNSKLQQLQDHPSPIHNFTETITMTTRSNNKKIASDLSVVGQVRTALKSQHRLATFFGFLMGGLAPLVSYVTAHYEIDPNLPLYSQVGTLMVVGCLLFSAITVYKWSKLCFNSIGGAFGFVLMAEGTLIFCHIEWLSVLALGYLIVINGIATGCQIALPKSKPIHKHLWE